MSKQKFYYPTNKHSYTFLVDIHVDVGNRANRDKFIQSVSKNYFLNKCDIHNIRVKVQDRVVIRHQDDAQSVCLAVSELQQEPYNPIMAFKVQGDVYIFNTGRRCISSGSTDKVSKGYVSQVCRVHPVHRFNSWD